jgi:hypothetical protein
MLKLFQVCFVTGVLYTVISFILGHLLDFAGVGGDVDMDVDIDLDAGSGIDFDGISDVDGINHGDMSGATVSPLKPVTIAAFITVFGGVGMIFIGNGYNALIALAAAICLGLTVSYMLYRFIIIPLTRAQNTSAVPQAELMGSLAYATLSMKDKDFGKIHYSVGGNTYSAPAKSVDGKLIAKGVPVVIIEINKNTFYVKEVKGGNL